MAAIIIHGISEAIVNAGILSATDREGNQVHITGGLETLRAALHGIGTREPFPSDKRVEEILNVGGPLGVAAGDGDRAA